MGRAALACPSAPAYGEGVSDIDPGAGWVARSADALRDLGFTLLNSDHPAAPGGSQLLVALRSEPTLRHFDPEALSFWVARSLTLVLLVTRTP